MKLVAGILVLCVWLAQLCAGVAAASCAGWALFALSGKAFLLFLATLALTLSLTAISRKIVVPFARQYWTAL